MSAVVFAPTMLGGAIEARYRRMRPDIADLPWGSLEAQAPDASLAQVARRSWTIGAWLEQRAAAAAATLVRTLVEAGAPLDLVCVATRFPLDEMVHSELCARIANELGG